MLDQLRCVPRTIYCLLPKSWWKPQGCSSNSSDLVWLGHISNPFCCWVLLFFTFSTKLPAPVEGLNRVLVSLRLYFEVNILPGNASCLYHMPRITLHVEGVVLPEYIPWNLMTCTISFQFSFFSSPHSSVFSLYPHSSSFFPSRSFHSSPVVFLTSKEMMQHSD